MRSAMFIRSCKIFSEGDKRDSKSDMPETTVKKTTTLSQHGRSYFAPEPASRTRPRKIYTRRKKSSFSSTGTLRMPVRDLARAAGQAVDGDTVVSQGRAGRVSWMAAWPFGCAANLIPSVLSVNRGGLTMKPRGLGTQAGVLNRRQRILATVRYSLSSWLDSFR